MMMTEQTSTTSVSVLIVDDTPSNLIALEAVLKPLRVRVVQAQSGREALSHVEAEPFAVAVLDVQMPGMDGFEVARRIRETDHGRELPILFLTAIYRDEAYAKKGYQAGAADYITKPFDADILRARVKAFVDLFHQRESVRQMQVALRTKERDDALRRLVAFERIASAALESSDVTLFLRSLLQVFMSAADAADCVAIMLREGDELHMRASSALNEEIDGKYAVRVGRGFAGRIAHDARPMQINDARRSPLVETEWIRARGTRGLYGVPLVWDGHVFGVALLGSKTQSVFSESERRLFSAMVERAAWAVAKNIERTQLFEALQVAPAVVMTTRGPEHRCEFKNGGATSLLGGRDVYGQKAVDVFGDQLAAVLDVVWRTGEPFAVEELAVTAAFRGDGAPEERVFHLTATPLRNAATASMERILTFATDVTAAVKTRREREALLAERLQLLERERAARAEAESANRAKDEFLATVSHELRTPLNAILGWTTMSRAKAPPELDRALAIVERNARAQARIIEDVLDISRIVRGRLSLERKVVPAHEPLAAAVESVRASAEAKGIELATELGDLGACEADPERIQQVAWNILSNAIKFTQKGGRVTLRASREKEHITVRVTDSGPGIEPSFLPHIFEPFRQGDGSTTRRHGGLGLGLAIVRKLVDAHGGTVYAESEGVGKGSTFTIDLPIGIEHDGHHVPARVDAALAARRLDGVKVVVVDDEEDARALLSHGLGARGATVAAAATVDEALARVAAHGADVVVSDIGMPNADGYSLVKRLRSLPPERGGRTPAIALTAYARKEDRDEALAAGFQRHVAKPVDLDALALAVAELAQEGSS